MNGAAVENAKGSRGRSGVRLLRSLHAARWDGERMRAIRAHYGLSLRDAARLAGVGLSAYRKFEADRAPVPQDVYRAYRLALFSKFGPAPLPSET